ncbi:MAG TPA: PilZ domain-containing protein [Wenzhouxiangella sp.]|nr:PilZ domain-containing protein [Wenzhouxiangella sp.]
MAQKGILSYNIKDKQELYNSYMPFLSNGGLFVPSSRKQFQLGDEVLILLGLMDDDRIAIPGKVAWVAPPGAGISGVGVQFSDSGEARQAQGIIVSHLAGMLDSDKPTYTI